MRDRCEFQNLTDAGKRSALFADEGRARAIDHAMGVRLKKVLEMRARIARGEYRIPAVLIAEGMIEVNRRVIAGANDMYSA